MKTYYLPLNCCSCMKPHNTYFQVKHTTEAPPNKITVTLEVPVCNDCARKMQNIIYIKYCIVIGLLSIGYLIGSYFDSSNSEGDTTWVILGLAIGGVIGYMIGELYKDSAFPVKLDGTDVKFKNEDYQRLFKELNPDARL